MHLPGYEHYSQGAFFPGALEGAFLDTLGELSLEKNHCEVGIQSKAFSLLLKHCLQLLVPTVA